MGDLSKGDRIRASDTERERVAAWLASAFEEGRLDLAEYDRRTAATYAAVTRGDLAELLDDLPAPPRAMLDRRDEPHAKRERRARRERRNWVGPVILLCMIGFCLARSEMLAPGLLVVVIVVATTVLGAAYRGETHHHRGPHGSGPHHHGGPHHGSGPHHGGPHHGGSHRDGGEHPDGG
jgi:hypothetical protein